MINIQSSFSVIYGILESFVKENDFEVVPVSGLKKGELPISSNSDSQYFMEYIGQGRKFRLVLDEKAKTFAFFMAQMQEDNLGSDDDFVRLSIWAFDLNTCDDRDATSVGRDFLETMKSYTKIDIEKVKLPQTVSKSAAKRGEANFDTKTLATRFSALFPECKTPLKENIAKYGDFMPETFFGECVAPKVIQTLNGADKSLVSKMFNLFNEIYDDGNNDVQGVIVVTIFGQLKNDPKLLEIVEKHASELLNEHIVEVNHLLYGTFGKRFIKKMENPPRYKNKSKVSPQLGNM